MRLQDPVAAGIAKISLWSSRHAVVVLLVALVLTGGLGIGVTKITTNVDVADVLPRGDPNTAAAKNLTTQFKSTFTQQVTFQLHINPDRWERDNDLLVHRQTALAAMGPASAQPDPQNITDEVYVRAMAEMIGFIQREAPEFQRQISISNIYALINWTRDGSPPGRAPASFSIPGYASPQDALQYVVVDQAVKAAVLDTVDAISSPAWDHAVVLFMPEADSEAAQAELGRSIMAARDRYVEAVDAGETEFTVFGSDNKPLFTVDLPIANAHSSRLVEEDMKRLMPIVAAFIIAFLWVAFRNVRAIAISFASLAIGVTWTYGVMGYMGIALNTLNMTIVPLIMGVGIDYSIHILNEFTEHKAQGASDEGAFREAGRRAGLAMLIATLTTGLGLMVMVASPSLLMAQLGLLSAVAIVAIYVLTITFIPAAITLAGGSDAMGSSFRASKVMPAMARGVTRLRVLVVLLVLGTTVAATYAGQGLQEEAFGDPGRNFRPDDPIRQEHEQGLRYFYGMEDPDVKANILTFEGPGILTPEALDYMRAIEENLKAQPRVIDDTLRTVPFFLETWLTVKGGLPGAVGQVTYENAPDVVRQILEQIDPITEPGGVSPTFPDTEAEIRAEVEAMFESPMNELASIIVNYPTALTEPANGMAAMTFSVRAATYEDAAEVWHQVWGAVEAADRAMGGPPEGVHVAFVGNTATNYLFVAKELPWLSYMAYTATGILFVLVLLFTGSLRATVAATVLAGLTSIWWLGVLPLIDIGLAVTLMLPLVFIFNIGTDYAVHIIWSMRQVRSARAVFATTGKAILFSAITTTAAFAVFIFIRNVAVSRTMVATTIAIAVIFLATMLVVPLFYPVRKDQPPEPPAHPPRGGHPSMPAPAPTPATPAAVVPPRAPAGGDPPPRAVDAAGRTDVKPTTHAAKKPPKKAANKPTTKAAKKPTTKAAKKRDARTASGPRETKR